MATIKSYTDLEQSRKLAEILPLESADMHYYKNFFGDYMEGLYNSNDLKEGCELKGIEYIPAWSLAALFSMLPKSAYLEKGSSTELCRLTLPVELISSDWNLEPIDTCVDMIIKLHELNLL